MRFIFKKKSNERQDESYFCPYCSSAFPTKEMLSKHIDDIHTGRGWLAGFAREW